MLRPHPTITLAEPTDLLKLRGNTQGGRSEVYSWRENVVVSVSAKILAGKVDKKKWSTFRYFVILCCRSSLPSTYIYIHTYRCPCSLSILLMNHFSRTSGLVGTKTSLPSLVMLPFPRKADSSPPRAHLYASRAVKPCLISSFFAPAPVMYVSRSRILRLWRGEIQTDKMPRPTGISSWRTNRKGAAASLLRHAIATYSACMPLRVALHEAPK